MKALRLLALAAVFVLSNAFATMAATVNCNKKIESFDFVVDYSGSMMMKNAKLKLDKVEAAKVAMMRINDSLPNQTFNAGLHTITPNGVLLEQGPWDRANMKAALGKLRSNFQVFGRMTGMGDGLHAYEPFLSSMKRKAAVILATDGDNNRGSDLVEVCRQMYATQRDLVIHIISLADTPNGEKTIKQIADLNPATVVARVEDLATSDAAIEQFIISVFCSGSMVEEDVLVLRGVNFAYNSAELDGKAKGILNEVASILKAQANKQVMLLGWTDNIGSDNYNQGLSQRRANAVKNYLTKQGVPANRLKAVGRGKSYKYSNDTEEGRYQNRRTEVTFSE